MNFSLEAMRAAYPVIPWDKPLTVMVPGVGEGAACRICVAAIGLKAREVVGLPATAAEHAQHLEDVHGDADPVGWLCEDEGCEYFTLYEGLANEHSDREGHSLARCPLSRMP